MRPMIALRKKKIGKRIVALLCVFALSVQLWGMESFAASLEGSKGTMNISSDSSNIYISYEGEWSNYIGESIQLSADSGVALGALSAITLNSSNDGDGGSVRVCNAWSSEISGASGSVTNSGKKEHYGYETMKWNISVPVSTYADYDFSKMTFTWGGKSTTLTVKENTAEPTTESTTEVTTETTTEATTEVTTQEGSTTETTEQGSTETTTETTTEVGTTEASTEATTEESSGDIIVSGNVAIDGMYDDWKDIPKTDISYDSNNAECVHIGQMYTDGTNIYAHFQTNALYTSGMQYHLWYLTINGQEFPLLIYPGKNGNIDWGTPSPTGEGSHTNLQVFIGYGSNNECGSSVVYTVYDENHAPDTPGDDIEFSFSLERLSELTGIEVEQMGTISLRNPNLGGASVTIAGSSTGPVAGVIAAVILAAAYFKKKKGMIEA